MKLVIQIPCLNEGKTLVQTIRDLPKEIPGIDTIEVMVIDDGSTDDTVAVAGLLGVRHVVVLGHNRGLARAFSIGLQHALAADADIIVNTDGDNQYNGADIAKLVQPILHHNADMVIGCRPINDHPEFGFVKKSLQKMGSAVLRVLSGTSVPDAASGFRAFSRTTAQRLFVHSKFSYCMETLIQAGKLRLKVMSVDVAVNRKTRDSRLFTSIWEYMWKSGTTMLAMFIYYRPSYVFGALAVTCYSGAFVLGARFIYLVYLSPHSDPHRTYIPSLILLATLAMFAVGCTLLAVVVELIRGQTQLVEEILFQLRRQSDVKK